MGCDEDSGTEGVSLSVVPSSTSLDEVASAEDDEAGAVDAKAFEGEAELFGEVQKIISTQKSFLVWKSMLVSKPI